MGRGLGRNQSWKKNPDLFVISVTSGEVCPVGGMTKMLSVGQVV